MAEPIDLPMPLQRAVSVAWTMEMNHGLAENAFNGRVQAQRGQLERWSFVMGIKPMNRRDAQVAQGFFLQLEGPLGLFRMADPAALAPLGRAAGLPVIEEEALPGQRQIETSGWLPNVSGILMAGDWIQFGDQYCKVVADVHSSATGTATVSVWPKVMQTTAVDTPIVTRPAKGLFRFTSQAPSWEFDANRLLRPVEIRLSGVQEVLGDA
jgi:hypothetical protein